MADEQTTAGEAGTEDEVVADAVSSNEEKREAASLGWVDLPKFRGEKSGWVDAKTFVEKGKHILPIMKENNRRLQGEVRAEREKREALETEVAGLKDTTKALQEFYAEETNRRVKETREQLLVQLEAAEEAEDHKTKVKLTSELSKLDAEAARREDEGGGSAKTGKAALKATTDEGGGDEQLSPAFLQWQADNADWWGVDKVKTQRAWLIAQELRTDAENDSLLGRPFFERVAEVLDERYGKSSKRTTKVEGGRGGGTMRSTGKDFASLPKEARDAAHDKMTARFVGPGKLYKTMTDWETQFAKDYYAQE